VENFQIPPLPLSLTTPCPTFAVPDSSSSFTIHVVCHTHTLAGIIPMSNIARPKSGPRLQKNSALSGGDSRPGSRMGARGTGSPASMKTLARALWGSTRRMCLFATHLHSLSLPLLRCAPFRCPLTVVFRIVALWLQVAVKNLRVR
jgi:hypothetical protein